MRCAASRSGMALSETGTVNAATLAALNVPVSERIRQIELNLERWRWLPDDFGSRYILVNIPSFKMNVVENGKRVMESKVVVGRQERQTPTFSAKMAYLVMSPKWYVPRSIAVKDKLPQLKRNPYSLARQNIRIFNSAGQQINPGSINWSAVSAGNFNYQLRQDAGPRNALGGIKFMFPNPYNVYLHDTPSRGLFSRNQRTFSSGCIRISNPVELAEYLLKHDPKWNRDTIKTAAASGKQRVVNLPQQVPVYSAVLDGLGGRGRSDPFPGRHLQARQAAGAGAVSGKQHGWQRRVVPPRVCQQSPDHRGRGIFVLAE